MCHIATDRDVFGCDYEFWNMFLQRTLSTPSCDHSPDLITALVGIQVLEVLVVLVNCTLHIRHVKLRDGSCLWQRDSERNPADDAGFSEILG